MTKPQEIIKLETALDIVFFEAKSVSYIKKHCEAYFGERPIGLFARNKEGDVIGISLNTSIPKIEREHLKVSNDVLHLIQRLTSLQYLNIGETGISDISPIGKLTNLKYLNLSYLEDLSDISCLYALSKLEHIEIVRTKVFNISALSSMPMLKTAILNGNRISDISSLRSCPMLREIDVLGNPIVHDNKFSHDGSLGTVLYFEDIDRVVCGKWRKHLDVRKLNDFYGYFMMRQTKRWRHGYDVLFKNQTTKS